MFGGSVGVSIAQAIFPSQLTIQRTGLTKFRNNLSGAALGAAINSLNKAIVNVFYASGGFAALPFAAMIIIPPLIFYERRKEELRARRRVENPVLSEAI
ncbi:hypothetical protein BKA66DRAFT_454701 [Pyrenochaeta sp. MPI-SDFR-AT-0127]|nr:hypothetical protein BKA66DRAFT_454701 [Pyrenochaeta sp. MPI-SDFR-AT-0127]